MSPHAVGCLVFLVVPVLIANSTLAAEQPVIPRGDSGWKYLDENGEPGEKWRDVDYDDAQWSQGQALLGYGDDDVRTKLSFGNNVQNKRPVVFFRKLFQLGNRSRYKRLAGRVCCDDGAVVYVNRREVFRRNLPQGDVTPATLAVRAVGPDQNAERQYVTFLVADDAVQDGRNVVAISVHQATPTSSDLALDLELVGLETDEDLHKVEESIKQQAEPQTETAREPSVPVLRFNVTSQ